jgi:prepilin-type processing-associated H-X9-DG protein
MSIAPGVFMIDSKTHITDITDGTSNTVLLSELLRTGPGDDMRGVMHYPEGPLYQHTRTPNDLTPDAIRSGACVSIPRAPCTGAYPDWTTRQIIMTARSGHTGGVNVVMADGAVRFANNSISLAIWQALATPQAVAGEPAAIDF